MDGILSPPDADRVTRGSGTFRILAELPEYEAIEMWFGPEFEGVDLHTHDDMGKVSIVGAGMRSHPGVAAKMFRTLADEDVGVRLISTSPIKITVTVARGDVERAVRSLHTAFGLGEDDAVAAAN